MKKRAILLIFVMLAVIGALLFLEFSPAIASSHREAPFITEHPKVDGTDFYMFRSYEEGRDGFVTLIANYLPLQDPYGGPNYFTLDPAARYRINIENDGNLNEANEDIVFEFQFINNFQGGTLPVGGEEVEHALRTISPLQIGAVLDVEESYTVSVTRGGGAPQFATNGTTGGISFAKALDYFGEKTFPDYESYAASHVVPMQIPGCDDGRVFVGQRKESFAVNLGEIFDLVNLDPLGNPDGERSDTADKNITSLALEVPTDCLTDGGGEVIGAWTTSLLPQTRTFVDNPTSDDPDQQTGAFVQVSRLGNPLVNELAIGLPDKNLFNAAHPRDDGANFLRYVTNPTLPVFLETLFAGTLFAPTNSPRNDLVKALLTGFPGLNEDGSVGEIMPLNTSIAPAPRGQQDRLGVLGGDLGGFPNGRRPGDDVVDIELQVFNGGFCHVHGSLEDGIVATLTADQVVPPVNDPNDPRATCAFMLNQAGNGITGSCQLQTSLPGLFAFWIHEGTFGQNGPGICFDDRPIEFDNCFMTPEQLEMLAGGEIYVRALTTFNPDGHMRGQLGPPSRGLCNPSDAPSGLLDLTDGVYQSPHQFGDTFPYLNTPLPGSPNEGRTFRANLIDDNLEQEEPFEPTDASGYCEMARLLEEGLGFELICNHNVPNPEVVRITEGGPNGETLWEFEDPESPLKKVLDGSNYMGSEPLEIFADGFESGDTSAWSTVGGNPTKIGGPFR